MTQDQAATTARRRTCRCGVWESAHREGRGCGRFRKASRVRVWFQTHELQAHIIVPIWRRVPEKHRWTVVSWLNKSRRRCWSDLVMDALAWAEGDPCDVNFPRLRGSGIKSMDCASVCGWMHREHSGQHACACCCGKFQFNAPDGAIDRRVTTTSDGSLAAIPADSSRHEGQVAD